MVEIKINTAKSIFYSIVIITIVLAVIYVVGDPISAIIMGLVVGLAIIQLEYKLTIDEQEITIYKIFRVNKIPLYSVSSVWLKTWGKTGQVRFTFKSENGMKLGAINPYMFKKNEVVTFLDAVAKYNNTILLSDQTKKYMEGDSYRLNTYKDL